MQCHFSTCISSLVFDVFPVIQTFKKNQYIKLTHTDSMCKDYGVKKYVGYKCCGTWGNCCLCYETFDWLETK